MNTIKTRYRFQIESRHQNETFTDIRKGLYVCDDKEAVQTNNEVFSISQHT